MEMRRGQVQLKSIAMLRACMDVEKLSVGEVGKRVGCSKGFISHLLAGRRDSCSLQLGERIARTLGVPLEVLFLTHDSQAPR
ncbi:antitoxin component HigA of HigAB toxin-antitoxin module [Psychromicrobium silvestre]|uniref:Antitoxin component HigA of HigAB toxin-antitoxin module n=1 Tax=Psychromicrobium silvestre TaxID=1645614 RepID=A0A7Y9LU07_9MICC|nr:antitoxin component HigA of HigAB toxin-antitoxin module [Psychromicrobium silvestre]